MSKKITLLFLSITVLFIGCNKDDDEQTTAQKLMHKWSVATIVEDNNGAVTTYTGLASDYIDYRTDGKVYYNTFSSPDTLTYTILNDKYIVEDNLDTFEIKSLTNSNLVLYYHNSNNTYKYTENLFR